ncbi:calcium-dependent protein kinase [Methanofollis aquaemaris]|uniref:Calcium-dependent protein kinase n=1 Tax=Methanofollis aquaemaris TaxID=126734 RepID=A0A8A3S529_9EURY|nr:calcium-dependent protein kinase [Methanofollis aquaemaris]QSZ66724.1 calcium-dependent protein kinase [Methanofollis aquaemaris]
MKKIIIILAGVLALIVVLALCALLPVDGEESGPLPANRESAATAFEMSTEFPELTDASYSIYRTDVPAVTAQSVEEVAARFGMTGKAEVCNQRTGEMRVVDDSKDDLVRLSMYPASGAVLYEVPDRMFPNAVTEPPALPSREEVIAIADAFLEERELLPSGAEVSAVEVDQRHEVWTAGSNEPEETYDVTLAVRYARTLDGFPVYGDEMAVTIGDGGDVVGMVRCWREVEATEKTKVISAEEAYEDLKVGKTVRPGDASRYGRVLIEEISIGYWMEPRISDQETVAPVWVFSGTAYYGGVEEPYQEYVAAVEGGVE